MGILPLIHFFKQNLNFLIHTILKWTLIVLLFLIEFLTFSANEFASSFDMKIPRVLCSSNMKDFASNSPRCYCRVMNRQSTLERTGWSPESSETSVSNEGEESMSDLSSSQVCLDRKPLMDLYMELDEERNASAVAANNALAMITRLQAEKAAIQMEALQYQRLMEEEVEHDEESLRATDEMLLKKEEEVMELEIELALYRERYGSSMEDEFQGLRNVNAEDSSKSQLSHSSNIFQSKLDDCEDEKEKVLNGHQAGPSQIDFEEE